MVANKGFQEIDYRTANTAKIAIGVLGYGFMGKVHSNAYLKIPYTYKTPAAFPELVAMGGRTEEKVEDTARRFGYLGYYTDWRSLIENPRIQVFDNCAGENMHYEPSVAAVEQGKHLICEKPLAMSADEAKKMLDAAERSGVKHMCMFNYRFIPAVRLARDLLERRALGTIYQFRARYLQQQGHSPDEVVENIWYAKKTRTGVLGGIGCHVIDLARFLVGEISAVSGIVKTFHSKRKTKVGDEQDIDADEGNVALIEFENGAIGTLESSGVSTGRKNHNTWEINGSKGSLLFDLEDLNHLQVYLEEGPLKETWGFSNVSVTEPFHPFQTLILPRGHNAGWEYGHVHGLHHFINCVVNDLPVAPYGATFEDGYKAQVVVEAIKLSSKMGKRVGIKSISNAS